MDAGKYSDRQFYADVVEGVRSGHSYYEVVDHLQRAHDYPLRPFYAVRPPTMAWFAAWLGPGTIYWIALGLLAACALAWYVALERTPFAQRLSAVLLLIPMAAFVPDPAAIVVHEIWCGLLLCLALAIHRPGRAGASIVAAGAALMIRELALPYVLLALAFALRGGRRREAWGWIAVIALFAAYMAWHAAQVAAIPGNGLERPWHGLRGPFAMFLDIINQSFLGLMPSWVGISVLSLMTLGWLGMGGEKGLFGFLFILGYAVMVGVGANEANELWALIVLPTIGLGLPYLWTLAGRARRWPARPSGLQKV